MSKFHNNQNLDWEELEEEAFRETIQTKKKPKKKRKSYNEFSKKDSKTFKINKKNSSR